MDPPFGAVPPRAGIKSPFEHPDKSLAGRVDKVSVGFRAPDFDWAPAETGVEGFRVHVRLIYGGDHDRRPLMDHGYV